MNQSELQRLAQFLFEIGTMRKTARSHRQLLLTDDLSDSIAAHSFRVAVIGYVLALMEGVDHGKVVMMCLLHDVGESRTNDHNWVHKRYTTESEELILREQLGSLPFSGLFDVSTEYHRRESRESIVAKDADVLDQILLLKEYAWQGNHEAQLWLDGKTSPQAYNYTKYLKTASAVALGKALYDEELSSWWRNLYTNVTQTT